MSDRGPGRGERALAALRQGRAPRLRGTAADRAWLRGVLDQPLEAAWEPPLMRLAWDRAAPGAALGSDGLPPSCVAAAWLEHLADEVRARRYEPAPLREFVLEQGAKRREIGVPTTTDQALVAAWRLWAEPRLEARLAPHTWGFRPRRDRFGAVRALGRATVGGGAVLLRFDVASMFESLDHHELDGAAGEVWGWPEPPAWGRWWPWWRLRAQDEDPLAAWLLRRWLEVWSPRRGVPTGVAASPMWANAYMARRVDPCLARLLAQGRAAAAVRYADDFAVLAEDVGVLREVEAAVRASRLRLNPRKTKVHRLDDPADWPARVLGVELVPERVAVGFRLVRAPPAGL